MVLDNLRRAFPEKTEKQIHDTAKKFYHFFSDTVVETIKLFDLTPAQLSRRVRIINPEVLEEFFHKGRSVAAICAHYGNWEWLLGSRNQIPHHSLAVYKTLNNKLFNDLFLTLREKFNTELVSMRDIIRVLYVYEKRKTPVLTAFISDQSPVWEEIQYWTEFLNQQTPVYLGPEKLASQFKMAVVFLKMIPVKRGYYEIEVIPVTDDASKEHEHIVTEKHVALLEETIRENPAFWLWSHRRWKLTRKREREEQDGVFKFEGKFRKETND